MGRSIEDGAVVKAHVLVYIIIYSTYVCMYVFCLSVTNDIFNKKKMRSNVYNTLNAGLPRQRLSSELCKTVIGR